MSLIAQTISFQYQSNDTWLQPAHLHCLSFTKINIHRSVAHSTCGILSRALPVLLSASEHTCSWGLSQALSSMCALCLLTQAELSGADPAFTAHTVGFSLCSCRVGHDLATKQQPQQYPKAISHSGTCPYPNIQFAMRQTSTPLPVKLISHCLCFVSLWPPTLKESWEVSNTSCYFILGTGFYTESI